MFNFFFISTIILFSTNTHAFFEPKNKFINQFAEKIQESKLVSQQKIHPLLQDTNLEKLYTIATQTKEQILANTPPNAEKIMIYSLGQSPAWLIYMMKLIDEKNRVKNTDYDFIAFSSNLFEGHTIISTKLKEPKVIHYAQYLRQKIRENEKNYSCIVEFPHHCEGLYSFDYVAQQSLPKHFNYFISKPYSTRLLPKKIVTLNFDEETIKGLIAPLANADDFDDRLVMRYPHYEWLDKDPNSFQPSPSAQLLQNILKAYVDRKSEERNNSIIQNKNPFDVALNPAILKRWHFTLHSK